MSSNYKEADQLIELMVAPVLFSRMMNNRACTRIISENGWGDLYTLRSYKKSSEEDDMYNAVDIIGYLSSGNINVQLKVRKAGENDSTLSIGEYITVGSKKTVKPHLNATLRLRPEIAYEDFEEYALINKDVINNSVINRQRLPLYLKEEVEKAIDWKNSCIIFYTPYIVNIFAKTYSSTPEKTIIVSNDIRSAAINYVENEKWFEKKTYLAKMVRQGDIELLSNNPSQIIVKYCKDTLNYPKGFVVCYVAAYSRALFVNFEAILSNVNDCNINDHFILGI